MSYRLGINTGFALNRYSEPEVWAQIVAEELGLRYVQFTADLLNPSLPASITSRYARTISKVCEQYNININSCFTGAFTRVNHLAHPDIEIRNYWVKWFRDFIDIAIELGAESIGSHFGIFTAADNNNKQQRADRRKHNIEHWHQVGEYAAKKGLKFISWEPMSISREQGETITECRKLQDDVNKNAPLPFKICLDVDHGDVCSPNPADTDPYAWIKEFAKDTAIIHLKQTTTNKHGHWPFIEEYNKVGKITPEKVIQALETAGVHDMDLVLELSFREREPADSTVIPVLRESVNYWRTLIKD